MSIVSAFKADTYAFEAALVAAIKLSALNRSPNSNVSPKLICENNVVGSVSVFTAAIRNKVKRIVYCSSMARYGNARIPYEEHIEPKPVDPYGVSKVAAENILKIF